MYTLWQCDETVGGQYEPLELVEPADPLRDALQLVTRSDEVLQFSQFTNGGWDTLKRQTIVWDRKVAKILIIMIVKRYFSNSYYVGATQQLCNIITS